MQLVNFWRTPTAALQALTVHKGPYTWLGFMIGRFFFGVMWCSNDRQ